jgi:hypothetical protein
VSLVLDLGLDVVDGVGKLSTINKYIFSKRKQRGGRRELTLVISDADEVNDGVLSPIAAARWASCERGKATRKRENEPDWGPHSFWML